MAFASPPIQRHPPWAGRSGCVPNRREARRVGRRGPGDSRRGVGACPPAGRPRHRRGSAASPCLPPPPSRWGTPPPPPASSACGTPRGAARCCADRRGSAHGREEGGGRGRRHARSFSYASVPSSPPANGSKPQLGPRARSRGIPPPPRVGLWPLRLGGEGHPPPPAPPPAGVGGGGRAARASARLGACSARAAAGHTRAGYDPTLGGVVTASAERGGGRRCIS